MAETLFAQALVWGLVAAVVVGVGYVLLGAFNVFSGFAGTDSTPVPRLSAKVQVSSSQIHIGNNDSFDWTACKITLNAGLGGSWSQEVGRIPAGETVSGGLMGFTRGRGERFNPFTHAIEDVLVNCATPAGRTYWSGRL